MGVLTNAMRFRVFRRAAEVSAALFVTPTLLRRAENNLDDFKKRIDVFLPKQGANLQLSFMAD
jgi:capsule polysaccharide export protein KpsE/RkpR